VTLLVPAPKLTQGPYAQAQLAVLQKSAAIRNWL